MVEAGELELIKISSYFRTHFKSSWVEYMEEFTEVTKLVEATHFLFHFICFAGYVRIVALVEKSSERHVTK